MSKNKPKRKNKRKAFEAGTDPSNTNQTQAPSTVDEGRRWFQISIFIIIAIGGTYLANAMRGATEVPLFTYEIVNEYPHDPDAFTQGLILEKGDIVWESTGKYGKSSIRKVDLTTGDVLKEKKLDDKHFGEGLARVDDKLYQLTWKKGICHVYDLELNKLDQEFKYRGQGWGLTYDGKHLIMSDGTSRLRKIDPETFEEIDSVRVLRGRQPIDRLNELEFAGNAVYANRLNSDKIYKINPNNGQVTGIIDLRRLWDDRPREGVLNGIAIESFDRKSGRVIVTGKYCPKIFEIKIVPKK